MTVYRRKSSAIKVAVEFVIRFALSELGGKFDIAIKAEAAVECCAEPSHVFLICARHPLSGCCTSTITSSASCILSTLCCQLTFRIYIFDFCKSIQNRPRCDASKNQLFLPPQVESLTFLS